MTETKSEWTKDHPKAVGWWVCADGVKRWVCGPSPGGKPIGGETTRFPEVLVRSYRPIRPYVETKKIEVETKKIEVEAWGVVDYAGDLIGAYTGKLGAEDHKGNYVGRTVVRLTGAVEIEA